MSEVPLYPRRWAQFLMSEVPLQTSSAVQVTLYDARRSLVRGEKGTCVTSALHYNTSILYYNTLSALHKRCVEPAKSI